MSIGNKRLVKHIRTLAEQICRSLQSCQDQTNSMRWSSMGTERAWVALSWSVWRDHCDRWNGREPEGEINLKRSILQHQSDETQQFKRNIWIPASTFPNQSIICDYRIPVRRATRAAPRRETTRPPRYRNLRIQYGKIDREMGLLLELYCQLNTRR